jgi:hypothetical protein
MSVGRSRGWFGFTRAAGALTDLIQEKALG